MSRINRISTITATAAIAVGLMAGPASATHIAGETVEALQQDVNTLRQEANNHASQARRTARRAGSRTRRQVRRTAADRTRSTRSRVRTLRSDTQARVDRTRGNLNARVNRTVTLAIQHAERTRSSLQQTLKLLEQRLNALAQSINERVSSVLAHGDVTVTTALGTYRASWTRSRSCWNGNVSTPATTPQTRTRRRTGMTLYLVGGQRTSVDYAHGDVAASSGC